MVLHIYPYFSLCCKYPSSFCFLFFLSYFYFLALKYGISSALKEYLIFGPSCGNCFHSISQIEDKSRELRALKLAKAHVEAELAGSRQTVHELYMQLEHQKETTQRSLAAAHSSAEMSSLISDMAKFRFVS